MNRNDLAFLAVRLAAVYTLIHSLDVFATGAYLMQLLWPAMNEAPGLGIVVQFCVPPMLQTALGLFLWIRAPRVSKWLLPPSAEPGESVTEISLSSLALGITGLLFCLHSLPDLVDVVSNFEPSDFEPSEDGDSLVPWWHGLPLVIGRVLQFLAALFIVFKAHAIARWWSSRGANSANNTPAAP